MHISIIEIPPCNDTIWRWLPGGVQFLAESPTHVVPSHVADHSGPSLSLHPNRTFFSFLFIQPSGGVSGVGQPVAASKKREV